MVAFNYPPLVVGLMGFLPALLVIMFAFNRYDGHFRDQTVFFFYMGGLIAGVPIALFHGMFLGGNPFVFIIGIAILEMSVKTGILNWKKWQGSPHAIFNGGAFGAGVASLLALAYGNWMIYSLQDGFRVATTNPYDYGAVLLLSIAFALVSFGLTAIIGVGVRDRTPFTSLAIAIVAYMPFLLLVGSYFAGYQHRDPGSWVWLAPALLYGAIAFAYSYMRVMPLGLTIDSERALRREARRKQA